MAHRILPSLASALQFGGASAAAILPLVLQMGKDVAPEDYSSVILVHLVKLFASPDRGTRLALLDHLPEYVDKLDKKTVVDKIWPHLVSCLLIPDVLISNVRPFDSKQDSQILLPSFAKPL